MSYPTVAGRAVNGTPFREPQVCLTPTFANAYYLFSLSGGNTAANVYQNGTLTTPFPVTGQVSADMYGRFPPIYLDPSVIYRVRFFNSMGVQQWQSDPYYSQLSTVGTSALSAYGPKIASTGEVTIPAPNTGGSGVSLTLNAGVLGNAALELNGTLAGNSALIVNNSVTTGAQTATFAATNKPGTSSSAPAGWLPITCDGVQYYAPMWFDNSNFTPYGSSASAQGEAVNASSVTFGGNGLTTATGGTATPGNWFSPTSTGIGAGYYINITKTGGLSGLAFSAAQGAWTNIGAGGLSISSNAAAPITGTYQLSTSVSGSPVAASGTITLSGNNGVQSPTYNGAANLLLAGNGTATLNGASTSNWYAPTTSNIGAGYYLLITQTGGTSGYSFSAATGTPANITNGGLTVGISGSGSTSFNVTGTYTISSDSAGATVLGSGNITLSGTSGSGSSVQSPNWSGTTPLKLNGDGSATLNGTSTSSWFSPNVANSGSSYYINITRTSGTAGVNFTAAQGAWTNITNSGLSIGMTGYTGDLGTVSVGGTYQISSSSSGTPVLGSGTISLSVVAGGSMLVTHTTAGSGTETIPAGASNCVVEVWGGTNAGGNGTGTGCTASGGGGGGAPGYSRTSLAVTPGNTFAYTVGAAGAASTVSSGTQAITTMTANAGAVGANGPLGAGGAGGTATGGNQANTTGSAGSAGTGAHGGFGGTATAGVNANLGSVGGHGGFSASNTGKTSGSAGGIAFYYT